MNYVLFDGPSRITLLPLTYTRPVADIRIGILTIREKWEKYLGAPCSVLTEKYLQHKFPYEKSNTNVFINPAFLPDEALVSEIHSLDVSEALLTSEGEVIALRLNIASLEDLIKIPAAGQRIYSGNPLFIRHPWDIFRLNGEALKSDYRLITGGRTSQALSSTNTVIGNEVFVEEGASVECAILNSTTGPVYIGKHAEVMEGSIIRGPFALCDHASTKMGSKIYGPTTIGPHSRVGGEISNSVILGYSNKGHDGFLGNSVIGEWCNLGADTNNSNLKNNYSEVKAWSYAAESYVHTGLQFCGLIMGDHSRCGINTMFNTGTVVGVNCNIYGSGFPPKHIPSFSWGGAEGFSTYRLDQAFDVAARVFERRNRAFDEEEKEVLTAVFGLTERYRRAFETENQHG
jgi:UDP-N-acetylglucosamine diphosphorylase/glucosamine-1-phosphate N-acetyltransferase